MLNELMQNIIVSDPLRFELSEINTKNQLLHVLIFIYHPGVGSAKGSQEHHKNSNHTSSSVPNLEMQTLFSHTSRRRDRFVSCSPLPAVFLLIKHL